jgi:hypothetical protein
MNVLVFYRLEAIWVDRVMGNDPSSIRMWQPLQQKVRNERIVFYRLEAIWVDSVMVPSSCGSLNSKRSGMNVLVFFIN